MPEAEKERAAVVAWLWSEAEEMDRSATSTGKAGNYSAADSMQKSATEYRQLAHAIERGDHLQGD